MLNALKRAGAVLCFPLAGVYYVCTGMGMLFVGSIGIALYATGKYIVTGKSSHHLMGSLAYYTDVVSEAPFRLLFRESKVQDIQSPIPFAS